MGDEIAREGGVLQGGGSVARVVVQHDTEDIGGVCGEGGVEVDGGCSKDGGDVAQEMRTGGESITEG